MEIAAKIFFGIEILIVGCFIAGFIDAWCEQHQREKANREKR